MYSIERLTKQHDRSVFDCGITALNYYIKQVARPQMSKGMSVVYVLLDDVNVVGFYTLSATHIFKQDDVNALTKYPDSLPIPAILIGRLAVDVSLKGKGIGKELLLHALRNIKELSTRIGCAYVIVDAKDSTAKQFYQYHGFKPLGDIESYRLYIHIKELP